MALSYKMPSCRVPPRTQKALRAYWFDMPSASRHAAPRAVASRASVTGGQVGRELNGEAAQAGPAARPAVNAITAVGTQKIIVNTKIVLRMALLPLGNRWETPNSPLSSRHSKDSRDRPPRRSPRSRLRCETVISKVSHVEWRSRL